MTTNPRPSAREIAEKYVKCPAYCMMFFWPDGRVRIACTCGAQARVTALAQAIEEYAHARLADYRATDNAILELLTGVRSMPLFQEDANEVP